MLRVWLSGLQGAASWSMQMAVPRWSQGLGYSWLAEYLLACKSPGFSLRNYQNDHQIYKEEKAGLVRPSLSVTMIAAPSEMQPANSPLPDTWGHVLELPTS